MTSPIVSSNSSSGSPVTPVPELKPGSYNAAIPSADIEINDNSINFKGCKTRGILYRV